MDRDLLERMLAEDRSLEQIGRQVGRHPSTVSYWLRKFGLEAAHRDRHLAKGGLPLDALRTMLEGGSTYAEMAGEPAQPARPRCPTHPSARRAGRYVGPALLLASRDDAIPRRPPWIPEVRPLSVGRGGRPPEAH